MLLADRHQIVHVSRLAGQVHRHNRSGLIRNGVFHLVQIEGIIRRHVDKDRPGSQSVDSARRRDKGIRRGDHFVAVSYAQRLQAEHQRVGAAVHANGVFGADQLSKMRLEFGHLGAEGEISAHDELADFFENLARFGELFLQIGISNLHKLLLVI